METYPSYLKRKLLSTCPTYFYLLFPSSSSCGSNHISITPSVRTTPVDVSNSGLYFIAGEKIEMIREGRNYLPNLYYFYDDDVGVTNVLLVVVVKSELEALWFFQIGFLNFRGSYS